MSRTFQNTMWILGPLACASLLAMIIRAVRNDHYAPVSFAILFALVVGLTIWLLMNIVHKPEVTKQAVAECAVTALLLLAVLVGFTNVIASVSKSLR